MNKIVLWVDDDVNKPALLPDRDELESRGVKIIPAVRADDFLKIIDEGLHKIDCIIIDMSMATGISIDINEAKNGTRTGFVLIKRLKESCYKDVPVVVYAVSESQDIKDFCNKETVEYLEKSVTSKKFADKIINELIS